MTVYIRRGETGRVVYGRYMVVKSHSRRRKLYYGLLVDGVDHHVLNRACNTAGAAQQYAARVKARCAGRNGATGNG